MSGTIKQNGLLGYQEVEKKAYEELITEYKEKIIDVNNKINRFNINRVKEEIKKEMNIEDNEEVIGKFEDEMKKLRSEYYTTLSNLEIRIK